MGDLSGLEDAEWPDALSDAELPRVVVRLLALIGSLYLPFLAANAAALAAAPRDEFEVTIAINGRTFRHRQRPFKYQGKCLTWLREEAAALHGEARARARDVLGANGCWRILCPTEDSRL